MPIFDYRCTDCKTLYDIFHKGKEIVADIQCPSCGSVHYAKLLSLPSVIVKGKTSMNCASHGCGIDKPCCGEVCGLNEN